MGPPPVQHTWGVGAPPTTLQTPCTPAQPGHSAAPPKPQPHAWGGVG